MHDRLIVDLKFLVLYWRVMARSKSTATPAEVGPSGEKSNLRLVAISSKLSTFQRELFDTFWNHYQQNGKWPSARLLHSRIGTHEVRDALRSIGGDIIRELEN